MQWQNNKYISCRCHFLFTGAFDVFASFFLTLSLHSAHLRWLCYGEAAFRTSFTLPEHVLQSREKPYHHRSHMASVVYAKSRLCTDSLAMWPSRHSWCGVRSSFSNDELNIHSNLRNPAINIRIQWGGKLRRVGQLGMRTAHTRTPTERKRDGARFEYHLADRLYAIGEVKSKRLPESMRNSPLELQS